MQYTHSTLIFFYKQPPHKQLALEASKVQATFQKIFAEIQIKRKVEVNNQQHMICLYKSFL